MKRIEKIQDKLKDKSIGAILITNPSNIFYLTGLKGAEGEREFLMVVSKNDFKIITSEIYRADVERKFPGNFIILKKGFLRETINILKRYKKIGFEREDLKYNEYEVLKKKLSGKKFIPFSGLVENFRKIKDNEEIKIIKKVVEITDKTFYSVLKIIKPGLTEKFIQRKIIETMKNFGADGISFEPCVASGKGSAEPHHLASNKKLKNNEILLIDMGVKYKGYCSDFTRTMFIGRAPERFKELYNIVLETQEKAIKNCRSGIPVKNLCEGAILNFKKYREDKYFTHCLGHGVGIDIHESPFICTKGTGKFEDGMVFAIEPGLYHKNFGGVRIEDLCLIDEKCKVLNKATKELIEIK